MKCSGRLGRLLALPVIWRGKQLVGRRIEAMEEALARHGTPEIFNTDWRGDFISEAS
jgi:hypothetical protein